MASRLNAPASRRAFLVVSRIATPLFVLLWVVFIIYNSSKTGIQSAEVSGPIATFLAGGQATGSEVDALEAVVRKTGHLLEYALLGLLGAFCLRAFTQQTLRLCSWPLLFGLVVATADECYQLTVPGRSGSVRDVLIDFIGLCAGCLLGFCILFLAKRFNGRRKGPAGPIE